MKESGENGRVRVEWFLARHWQAVLRDSGRGAATVRWLLLLLLALYSY